ncbi:IS3 family transposase [Pectinatus frisingensis]|uniref:IS3 family transposase n=1 Tax=Pectinatus frisingensis TaxID=865 RepID=UPI0018C5FBC0|nr:IS3 family transposase [Pectinatus frisingensis]
MSRWQKELRDTGNIACRGSGNYESDEAREIAKLKRKLRNTKDALDVLKKPSAFWKNNGSIYCEVSKKAVTTQKRRRHVSVTGMLAVLGVSRSGYLAWLKRVPSHQQHHKQVVQLKIKNIYNASKQNYGAPKIAKELCKTGNRISTRTVDKYMKNMGIRAQWVKPYVVTTKDSDFSDVLQNILQQDFNPE